MLEGLFSSGEVGGWWDADKSTLFQDTAGTTPVTADGDPVARWEDKSGNGYHLLQGTGTNQPTYRESGGIGWVDFDGVDDFMEVLLPVVNQPFGMAVSAQADPNSDILYMITSHTSDDNTQRVDFSRAGDTHGRELRVNAGSTYFVVNDSFLADTDYGFIANIDGATSDIYINGALNDEGVNLGTENYLGIKVGVDRGDNSFWDGPIYGVVYTDRLFTAQEITDVNDHHTAIYTEGQSYFDDTNPISGTIEDEAGNPVENAIVEIRQIGDFNFSGSIDIEVTSSDSSGSWAMSSSYDATKEYFSAVLYFDVELSGSATSGSSNTLVDTSLSMSNDEYSEKMIRITEGSGSGERAKINGNTSDTFTINRNWDEVVSSGSKYEVGALFSGPSQYFPRTE